jgi:hypothetical protein
MERVNMFHFDRSFVHASGKNLRSSCAVAGRRAGGRATFVLVNISHRFGAYVTPCTVSRHQHCMHRQLFAVSFSFDNIIAKICVVNILVLCKTRCRLPLDTPTFVIFYYTKFHVPSYNNLSAVSVKSKILHEVAHS